MKKGFGFWVPQVQHNPAIIGGAADAAWQLWKTSVWDKICPETTQLRWHLRAEVISQIFKDTSFHPLVGKDFMMPVTWHNESRGPVLKVGQVGLVVRRFDSYLNHKWKLIRDDYIYILGTDEIGVVGGSSFFDFPSHE